MSVYKYEHTHAAIFKTTRYQTYKRLGSEIPKHHNVRIFILYV